MVTYVLLESKTKNKKQAVIIRDGEKKKTINFGDRKYQDFLITNDDEQKQRYMKRHQKEDWSNLEKAGTWSRYILWNEKTLEDSIKDMEERFNIKIQRQ